MSDLRVQRTDQRTPPKPRFVPGNRPRRDRRPYFSDLRLVVLLLVTGCVRAPAHGPAPEVHRPEVWVDAFSPAGGDGSSARPFKTVPQPLPAGLTVHLRSGLYPGPFVLGEGTRFDGSGEVVLTGEAGQTVVTGTGATLERISVQGGAIGVEAGPNLTLTHVHFSGQRKQAVLVHGALRMSQATFEASVEGIEGVVVDRGATLTLSQTKFVGGFRRAVASEGGTLELNDVAAEGPKTLLHAIDAKCTLQNVRSTLGSGPALFFAGGTVNLQGAELVGHEFSVQLFRGVDATLSHVKARGALQACITGVGARLSLSRSTLTKCGAGGAVSLQGSQSVLSDVEISSAQDLGIFVKSGTLSLSGIKISQVAADRQGVLGDALHVRAEAEVTATGPITVVDVDGSALFASTYSTVRLPSLSVDRARNSALFVELGASVTIGDLLVRGGRGPAVVVPDKASVQLDSLSVAGGNEMPVYAECRQGAQVTVGRLESTVQQLPSQCVRVPARPR